MIHETLFDALGKDQTRIKRAFKWVITFRDFPAGSFQTVRGAEMMTEALTFFTKGKAEFYLDGVRRLDRVPGILSSEYDPVGIDGEFVLKYTEPSTRVCIPSSVNHGRLPAVRKIELTAGQEYIAPTGFKALVCLGLVQINHREFSEEQSFETKISSTIKALNRTMLLEFI